MTQKELRQVLRKIVKEVDGFIFYKDMFIKPIENSLLKGVSFDLSSSGRVSVTFFIQPLYVLKRAITYTFGKELRDRSHRQWWSFDVDDQLFLLHVIKSMDIDVFQRITSSVEFYNSFVTSKDVGLRYKEGLVLALCKDSNINAIKELEFLIAEISEDHSRSLPWVNQIKINLELLLNSNELERQNILLKWEKETILNLKLEKYV